MDIEDPVRKLAGVPEGRPHWRLAAYYAALFSGLAVLVHLMPGALDLVNAPVPASGLVPGMHVTTPAAESTPWRVVLGTVVALLSACVLMLPVTWVYVQTRRKKGYDQSVVQTLVILPLVVAGVILLVQHSTALAFSLGGIVGAVTFRNTLRDTKDTIYIFLAIVIGVAAGVHALLVAATISGAFNLAALVMWWTDFGRVGAPLEGAPAERRLKRAKQQANRTGGFISLVDHELLRSMTPEQLEALAERARVRQHVAEERAELAPANGHLREWTLRVECAASTAQVRRVVDPLLASLAKRWEFTGTAAGTGGDVLEYRVRLRKKTDRADFLGRFRAAAGAAVRGADLDPLSAS